MGLTNWFPSTTAPDGNSTSGTLNAVIVSAVRGLHRILLATLGGVPQIEVKELRGKKEQYEKSFEGVLDVLHTPFILTDLETGKKQLVHYRDMLDLVCGVLENGKDTKPLEKYKFEKLDSQAAEVLYGFQPRPQKKN